MIKIGFVGLGTIFAWQKGALDELKDKYTITAVFDKNTSIATEFASENNVSTFDTLDAFLANADIDVVMVSTPPATHYDIAMQCIKAGRNVIVEKPGTTNLDDLKELYSASKEAGVLFCVVYHAADSIDIEWYLDNQDKLPAELRLDNAKEIESGFFDPYMIDGELIKDRCSLAGSFIDSGVNILSVLARLVKLENYSLVSFDSKEQDGVTYSSVSKYTDGRCLCTINTSWAKGINQKTTLMKFYDTDKELLLDHSNQSVVIIDGDDREVVFCDNTKARMHNQYINVYSNYEKQFNDFKSGVITSDPIEQDSIDIHRILFR